MSSFRPLITALFVFILLPNASGFAAQAHFGLMHPEERPADAVETGAHRSRPHPGPFIWGNVEPRAGTYEWQKIDQYLQQYEGTGFDLVVTVWPYAEWDQAACHSKMPAAGKESFPELGDYREKPCDMEAFQQFVQAAVERYDGDGKDDSPTVKHPIKHWEILNEPEMQDGSLVFFRGTSQEYLDIMKAGHAAVKAADPEAKVLHAGISGFYDKARNFWLPFFSAGGSDYFDITSYHDIGAQADLSIDDMLEFMDEAGYSAPIWVTEVEFEARALGAQSYTQAEWADFLVKSFTYAFARGAETLFYVGLSKSPADPEAWLVSESGVRQAPFHAYQTTSSLIDFFTGGQVVEYTSTAGALSFTVGVREVFVLWGNADVPEDLSGTVEVTDVTGKAQAMPASALTLTDSPVFVVKQPLFSGWMYDPSLPGTGVSIETQGPEDRLYTAIYMYDDQGNPIWYSALVDASADGTYSGILKQRSGYPMNEAPDPSAGVTVVEQGTIELTLDSAAKNASLDWTMGDASGSMSLVAYMPTLDSGAPDARDIHGWWYDPTFPGTGFFLETAGETLFTAWYHYAGDGSPQWRIMGGFNDIGGFTDSDTYTADLYHVQSGASPSLENLGPAELRFQPDGSAVFSRSGLEFAIQRFDFKKAIF